MSTLEMSFVLECLRARLGSGASPLPLPEGIDEQRLISLCDRHGLTALIHDRIDPSSPLGSRLGRIHAKRAARSLLLTLELQGVVDDLERASIPVLSYKGPALAVQAYGDVAARSFVDLDLLVDERDFVAARRVLSQRGYATHPPEVRSAPRAILERSECDETLVNGPLAIDLHWAVAPPQLAFPLLTRDLFVRARNVTSQELSVRAPSIEDTVLLLCMNGMKDAWLRLEIVFALVALASREVDWNAVFERASALHAERLLAVGLSLASQLFGTKPPVPVRDPVAIELAREVVARLDTDELPGWQERASFVVRSRERLRDGLMFTLGRTFTPTWQDAASVRLPAVMWPAYYLVRPFRLAFLGRSR